MVFHHEIMSQKLSSRGRLQMARAGPARSLPWQGRQQKILFQAGVVCRGQGPDRQDAGKKSYFRQGSCAEGKGLTGNTPIPRRGASKKAYFRQGSFADGKGRTGKKPTLAGAQAKNPISGRGRVQRARA